MCHKLMNNELHRDFKGVWIPKEIWLADGLTLIEKVFLVEIDSLDNKDGCYASNKHFQKFSGLSTSRCSQIINQLQAKGYIQISYIRDGKEVKKRVIKVFRKLNTPLFRKLNTPISEIKGGYLENAKESNTKSSNTKFSNTEKHMSGKPDLTPYSEIIDYMNNLYGSHFRASTNDTRKKIRGRFDDGFTLNDFKLAIAGQWLNWRNDNKMSRFLVPKTIFRASNFEGYVEDAKRRKDIRQDLAIAQQDQLHEEEMPF